MGNNSEIIRKSYIEKKRENFSSVEENRVILC